MSLLGIEASQALADRYYEEAMQQNLEDTENHEVAKAQ